MTKMGMKDILRRLPVLLSLVLLVLSGCEQKDSSVGSSLAPGLMDEYPQEVILDPVASAFYQAQATTGASPYLYAGLMNDHRADFLVKFEPYYYLPDSFAVDSLIVKLFLDSVLVADSDPLNIDVLFVNKSQVWAEIGITWDNLDSLELGDPITSIEVPSSAVMGDSVSFSFPAPDSLLRAWASAGSGEKTLHYNNGLYFKADPPSDQMVRFSSSEYGTISVLPRLEMYLTVIDTTDTTGVVEIDTLINAYPISDAFIANDVTGIQDSTYLYLGNAVACRSILMYDLDGLFQSYGVGIHSAEVILHADTTSEYNIDVINGAFTLGMVDTTWKQDPANAPIGFGVSVVLGYYDREEATLTLNLNDMVYDWIRNPGTNQGFMIKSFDEYLNISRTVFYGINAPDSLRPRLRIIYVENDS